MTTASTMDAEYVMFLPAGDWEFAGAEQRRTEAMRQWMCARAEEEYIAAVECVRVEGLNHTAAWRQFTRGHRVRSARTAFSQNQKKNNNNGGGGMDGWVAAAVCPSTTNWCTASVWRRTRCLSTTRSPSTWTAGL